MAETHKREIQHTTKTTTKDGHFVRPTTLTPKHANKVLGGQGDKPSSKIKNKGRFENQPLEKQLLSNIQSADQIQISLRIMLANIIQQGSPLANHSQKAASARVISGCTSHVLGHSVDTLRQHGNLHIGRTIVRFMR
jgi:superfamily II helicase